MKTKLENCSKCGEETLTDIGKKLAHKGEKHHIKRTISRCRQCGTREINNSTNGGKRIIKGKNETAFINFANSEVKDD